MTALLEPTLRNKRTLLVVAAEIEAAAILKAIGHDGSLTLREWTPIELNNRLDMVVSGVGKSAAAGATAKFLDPARHAAVLSMGVAGALPGSNLSIGTSTIATQSIFADEGFLTPTGFTDISSAGFPPGPEGGMGVAGTPELLELLKPAVDTAGPIATVSTCAGTDALANEVVTRTGAIAEAMEGGAVAVTAQRVSAETWFSELRVISNTTGDRDKQTWDLPGALGALGVIATKL